MAEKEKVLSESQVDNKEQEKKPEPIRMTSSAVGELAGFINSKIVGLIGEIEYYERAKIAGHSIPAAQTDYLQVKLRDYSILRDSITSIFYYKRLDEEEAKAIQKQVQEKGPKDDPNAKQEEVK